MRLQNRPLHDRWVEMVKHAEEFGFKEGNDIGFQKSKHLIGDMILVMLPDGKYVMEDDNPQVMKTWENCAQVAKSLGMEHYDSKKFSLCLEPTKNNNRVHLYGIQLRHTEDNLNPTKPFKKVTCLVYRQCYKCQQSGHKYPDQCS